VPHQLIGKKLGQVVQAVVGLAATVLGGLGLVGGQGQVQGGEATGGENQAGQQGDP
jgi:hypothetical protein